MYAALMQYMTLDQFTAMMDSLVYAKRIRRERTLLPSDEAMTDFDDILAAIGRLRSSLPRRCPRPRTNTWSQTDENLAAYTQLFDAIKSRGRPEKWEGRRYRYLYPGDGWKYWIMTTVLSQSRILNRARAAGDHEVVLERAKAAGRLPRA